MLLVTGGCGYIGSHVLLALATAGNHEPIIVVDNLSTGNPHNLINHETLISADLSDHHALESLFNRYPIDTVLHFAASLDVAESLENPLKYYSNNTANTLSLLRLCHQHHVKHFLFSSTAAVYGDCGPHPISESHPTNPISPYGWSKLMSERILQDLAASSNLRFAILRYFNVAGADPLHRLPARTHKSHHLLQVCFDAALRERPTVPIYGTDYPTLDGTGVRDYIHVSDLASAHTAALSYLQRGGKSDIFNVGYGTGVSVKQMLGAVERVTGKTLPVSASPRRPGDTASAVADTHKLRSQLAWKPQYAALDTLVATAWDKPSSLHP